MSINANAKVMPKLCLMYKKIYQNNFINPILYLDNFNHCILIILEQYVDIINFRQLLKLIMREQETDKSFYVITT